MRQPQKLRNGFFDSCVQIVVFIELKKVAFLVQLLTYISLKLLEALIKEFEQNEDSISIYQQLTEIDKLIDTIGLEMLEHEDEQVTYNHSSDNSMSIILVPVILQIKVVLIFRHYGRFFNNLFLFFFCWTFFFFFLASFAASAIL